MKARYLLHGILYACVIPMLLYCGSLKGEFGFKSFYDDNYRKKADPLEFDRKEEMKWVYSFPKVSGTQKIGVIVMKKEYVWVDMESRAEKISERNRHIYGAIKEYPAGQYKLVIVSIGDKNELIDEREFTVYSDESDIE